jgi:hypothetical protein
MGKIPSCCFNLPMGSEYFKVLHGADCFVPETRVCLIIGYEDRYSEHDGVVVEHGFPEIAIHREDTDFYPQEDDELECDGVYLIENLVFTQRFIPEDGQIYIRVFPRNSVRPRTVQKGHLNPEAPSLGLKKACEFPKKVFIGYWSVGSQTGGSAATKDREHDLSAFSAGSTEGIVMAEGA